jgi:hypothetical protein
VRIHSGAKNQKNKTSCPLVYVSVPVVTWPRTRRLGEEQFLLLLGSYLEVELLPEGVPPAVGL